jgi:two-component system, OmpR family, sensor kinase
MSGAQGKDNSRFLNGLRRLPERTPLRLKLMVALLGLVAVALTVISTVGIVVFRGYLNRQADSDIRLTLQSALAERGGGMFNPGDIHQFGPVWVIVRQANGQYDNDPRPPTMPVVPALGSADLNAIANQLVTVPSTNGTGNWRVIASPATVEVFDRATHLPVGSEQVTLIIGEDLGTISQTIGRLIYVDVLASLAIMTALTMAGAAAVRSSLRPLTDIEVTAGAIASGDLGRRVPDRDPRTEVGRLGRSLNTMLSQIESAFQAQSRSEAAARQSEDRMRQFIADASHELRTPLTAIRGYAEYYRQRGGVRSNGNGSLTAAPEPPAIAAMGSEAPSFGPRPGSALSGEDMNRIMQRVEQESARMTVMVEDLLLLARLDQQRPLDLRPVDMLTLAVDAVQDARMIAPGRPIDLSVVGHGAAFLILGDEVRLRQVLGNLMSNALTHTPDGTPVQIRLGYGTLDRPPAAAGQPGAAGQWGATGQPSAAGQRGATGQPGAPAATVVNGQAALPGIAVTASGPSGTAAPPEAPWPPPGAAGQPGNGQPGQPQPGHLQSGADRPSPGAGHGGTSQAHAGRGGSRQPYAGHAEASQPYADHAGTGQAGATPGSTPFGGANPGGAGQNGAGQNGAGQNGAGQNGAGQSRAGQSRAGENGAGTGQAGNPGNPGRHSRRASRRAASPGTVSPATGPAAGPAGGSVASRPAASPAAPAAVQVPAVVIDVADAGPGMEPEQAQRVFERFYRADKARSRQHGGTGLGLAIVAALVAAHGGTVALATAPGQGATFRITLPLAPESQAAQRGT